MHKSSLMEESPKRVTVLKAKFNKIVPKCSRFPIFGIFLHYKSNFCVLNIF